MPKKNDTAPSYPDLPYDENKGKKEEKEGETSTADMMARIDKLQNDLGNIAKENERLQRTNAALLSNPGTAVQDTGPEAPKGVDLSGMPDQYSDPQAYSTELNKRINDAISENVTYATQKTQQQQKVAGDAARRADGLWDAFTSQYPDYAEKPAVVRVAAAEVVENAKKRGMDTETYMYKTTDLFLADVAKHVKDTYGPMFETKGEDEEDEPEPANRTAGLHGGGQQAKPKAKPEDEDPGDFAVELQDVQRNMGIF